MDYKNEKDMSYIDFSQFNHVKNDYLKFINDGIN